MPATYISPARRHLSALQPGAIHARHVVLNILYGDCLNRLSESPIASSCVHVCRLFAVLFPPCTLLQKFSKEHTQLQRMKCDGHEFSFTSIKVLPVYAASYLGEKVESSERSRREFAMRSR